MRIGILTTVHAPLDTRIYFKQAASLAAAGHQVVLIARRGPAGGRRVRRVHLPVPQRRLQRFGAAFRAFDAARRLHCDVYHFHDPELLAVGVALKLVTRAKIVFDVHEHVRMQILDKAWIPSWFRPFVARAYGAFERLCLPFLDHVVVAMPTFESFYRRRPVTVIYNYPIRDEVASGRAPTSTIPGMSLAGGAGESPAHHPHLVYCGMVTRIRGALQMLEVTASLVEDFPRVHLTLIGPVESPALEAQIQATIRRHDLEAHVTATGRLPIDQAMQRIAAADLGLALFHDCHNLAQALPTKILEYMACAKPVILSDVGLGAPIVRGEKCGVVVPPEDAAAAARAIRELLSASAAAKVRLREMGENGLRAVRERYQWRVEEQKLLEIYATLVPTAANHSIIPGDRSPSLGAAAHSGQALVEPERPAHAERQLAGTDGSR
jgi:hypothetical protein